ncbi:MAG: holo-ACP synthase [Clostridia bacterium]|nr:holo-ACP synthase [Clostridia bacterium]
MAIACGVDIIEVSRIKKSLDNNGDAFREKVFTQKEIDYCESKRIARYHSYAARFAAKEAVVKALGTGISKGVYWKDIEVLNGENGCPYIVLHGKAQKIFEAAGGKNISLSLSHSNQHAIAFAVMEKQ